MRVRLGIPKYECKVTTTPTTAVAFSGVLAGSKIYVIANATKSGDATAPFSDGTMYTEAEVEAMSVNVKKAQINNFTTALQTGIKGTTDIAFVADEAMVMTGSALVQGTPDATNKVSVTVELSREFARVDAEKTKLVFKSTFGEAVKDIVTLDGTKTYIVRRVASKISAFTGVVANTTAFKDEQANGIEPTDLTGGYRYVYPTGLVGTTPADKAEAQNFYVTSNFATAKSSSTVIVYEVQFTSKEIIAAGTMTGQPDVIAQNTSFTRFYKAYVTENSPLVFNTEKGAWYEFSNTLTSWGSESEDVAINSETVNLDVMVTVKNWTVKTISVDMD